MTKKKGLKYLCLVYFEGKKLDEMSRDEHEALGRESYAYDVGLKKAGHLLAAEALQSTKNARTVAVRRDKIAVTDGPFAKTKEQLGGFILITARNMRQAVKLAAGIPLARLGRVEVRPGYEVRAG